MDIKLIDAIIFAEKVILNPFATSEQIAAAVQHVDNFKSLEASNNIRHVLGEIRSPEHLKRQSFIK